MEKVGDVFVAVYKHGDYRVDITMEKHLWEAWLYKADFGVKKFMFGLAIDTYSYDEFLEIVVPNLYEHEEEYSIDYGY